MVFCASHPAPGWCRIAFCRPNQMNIANQNALPSNRDSSHRAPMELVCPAGSLPALKAAVDNGADCVYLGFRDTTNARAFAGLNFDDTAIAKGVDYAHARGRKVFVAINTYPRGASVQAG